MAQAAKLLTLTEVAKRTNISMPTLQRYKKLYQKRIPSHGSGRKQRYPEEALEVFIELKKENIGRRGRPRKSASGSPVRGAAKATKRSTTKTRRKVAAKKSAKKSAKKTSASEELLTLTQVSKLTGVSYPTLLRYVKTNLADIPHSGTGRARRFKPAAVAVFKSLRERSKRGRKSKATLAAEARGLGAKSASPSVARRRGRPPKNIDTAKIMERVVNLEKTVRKLEKMIAKQQKQIEKPFRVVLARK